MGERPISSMSAVSVALVALLVAGCGGSPSGTAAPSATVSVTTSSTTASVTTASPSPSRSDSKRGLAAALSEQVAEGRTKVSDAALGYEFVLPRGYTRITSQKQLQELQKAGSNALEDENPKLAAAAAQAVDFNVFALNRLSTGTINLVVVDAGGSVSEDLADQAPVIVESLASQTGVTDIDTKSITIDGDPGLLVTTRIPGTNVRSTQLYAIHDDRVFIISISGVAGTTEKVVTAVLESVRFGG